MAYLAGDIAFRLASAVGETARTPSINRNNYRNSVNISDSHYSNNNDNNKGGARNFVVSGFRWVGHIHGLLVYRAT